MKYVYIIGTILFLLCIGNINAEQQILQNNISVVIQSTCNGTGNLNVSIKTQGGTPIDYFNLPINSNINENKLVYFIGELNCSQTVTAELIKNCNDYFNESCDGFPCQSAWLVCKDDLNKSLTTNNQSIDLMGNITNILNGKIIAGSSVTCSNACVEQTKAPGSTPEWLVPFLVGCGAGALVCYYFMNKRNEVETRATRTTGGVNTGVEKNPRDNR